MQQSSDKGKINSHTGLDVPTSFTTSDRNTNLKVRKTQEGRVELC